MPKVGAAPEVWTEEHLEDGHPVRCNGGRGKAWCEEEREKKCCERCEDEHHKERPAAVERQVARRNTRRGATSAEKTSATRSAREGGPQGEALQG